MREVPRPVADGEEDVAAAMRQAIMVPASDVPVFPLRGRLHINQAQRYENEPPARMLEKIAVLQCTHDSCYEN